MTGCASLYTKPDRTDVFAVYEDTLVNLLTEARPKRHFSICIVSSSGERTAVPFPHDVEIRILTRSNAPRELYVMPIDLRIPDGPETDPSDPTGQTLRGVEVIGTRQQVDLYSISGIRAIGPDTIEVHYSIYSSGLAARGGAYKVQLRKGKYQIMGRISGWES